MTNSLYLVYVSVARTPAVSSEERLSFAPSKAALDERRRSSLRDFRGEGGGIKLDELFPINFALTREVANEYGAEAIDDLRVTFLELIVALAREMSERLDDFSEQQLVARYEMPKLLAAIF